MSELAREEVLQQISTALVELFELDPAKISESARLNDDLELDSIDLFDLLIRLEETSGKKVAPEAFRGVATVGDIADRYQEMLQAAA